MLAKGAILAATLMLVSCTGVSQQVYNCNDFSVSEKSSGMEMARYSFYFQRPEVAQITEKSEFLYPGGTNHHPRMVDSSASKKLLDQSQSDDNQILKRICRAYPNEVVILQMP